MKIAFVTYNTLPNFSNGWVEGRGGTCSALIVQDTKGDGALSHGTRTRSTDEVRDAIVSRWDELDESLPTLDHLVVYVGSNGSEVAIERAAKLSVDKLTFVGCSCGIDRKEEMLRAVGLGGARRFLCECGGHRTMEQMIRQFLETGRIF